MSHRASLAKVAGSLLFLLTGEPRAAHALNEIEIENALPGNPPSQWDVSGAGDASIQGFATDISVAPGDTVSFKIDTNATNYRLDVYRLGWYAGLGARKVATLEPSATLPQTQPACLTEPATGLIDCGNWAVSAAWSVPANAVSGIYLAKLVREDPQDGRASHVIFVVRDDDGGSALLFQTMDTTWQAYNAYGGNSLYVGGQGPGRAYKVSYNRPFTTRGSTPEDWVFNAEFPLVRWLERNGFDVSYTTGVDSDRRGAEILEHGVFLSVGHDEYWSAGQRANVEAARDAGVHLAFLSGNEVFWKTRWEPSSDGSATSYRTLVSYKETHAGAKIDPAPVWTGTWRDPRAFNPEGAQPENALTGQIFTVNCCTAAISVPEADGKLRFWRGTSIATLATGQTATLPTGTLGYEWDEDLDNGFRPAGAMRLSTTTLSVPQRILDYGSSYGPGVATHHLTLSRAASGALVFGTGSIQWSWGLDDTHDRGSDAPDARMQQATLNLLADMGVQPQTLQAGLSLATASADATPPVSLIGSPAAGASLNGAIDVIGSASDTGGGRVGGVEVSSDGGATWHPASGRESWSYTFTAAGPGSLTLRSRAVDDSGNLEAPSAGVTITAAPASCPCSLWSGATTPSGNANENDGQPLEIGVKFRAQQAGWITGLRFYKGSLNAGPHVGHLWSAAGALLATASFAGESASGWQEIALAAPVAIAANTTYVASYHSNAFYAFDVSYFGAGVDRPPLRALADGEDGPNGVYQYGAAGFPTQTYNASNYWVDVRFETAEPVDETPPTVSSVAPANASTGVALASDVSAVFSEALNPATIGATSFELRAGGGALVPASVSWSAGTRTATLDPTSALAPSATYDALVKGGPSGVADLAGHPLAADFAWSFTTAAPPPPPPDEGPGGPILVVSDAANPFGRFYAEILRTEGLNAFTVTDIAGLDATTLAAHEVVILAEMSLSAAQVSLLESWVQGGGKLIAMRPDPQLAPLLGLTSVGGTLAESYLGIDTASGPGVGIAGQTLQYHGSAERFTLAGATAVATLYSDATTQTAHPAVTLKSVGSNGGKAASFAFDLARSVVLTRQGNPAFAGQERDGIAPIRSDDLFYPSWVDLSKVAIPQADEQQRLLANLILALTESPLPRFWYFPSGKKAVVILASDEHACCGGTRARFDAQLAADPPGCSLADWECVRSSSYVYPGSGMSDAEGLAYHTQGFELGVHVNTSCADWTPAQLEAFFSSQLATFAAQFPNVPAQSTQRTHCIAWSDWASTATTELAHGIRLDTNYYYWPASWVQDRPGMFTGSGMPMRFAQTDGTLIDVYQAATQMTDESNQTYPFTIDTLLDRAIGPEGYYGAFTANMHTDAGNSAASAWAAQIVASAQARGVPVVSGRQMLEWLDARNASTFSGLSWQSGTLTFSIVRPAAARNLRGMLPTLSSAGALASLTRGGQPVAFTQSVIKGVEYAFFPAEAGAYVASYLPDVTPPLISNVAASALTQSTALVSWSSNEAASSFVAYGTSPAALTASAASPGFVTPHAVSLSGLQPGTTYYFRVSSADAQANSATAPAPPAAPASFTTASPACLQDETTPDFAAGSTASSTFVVAGAGGGVVLAPSEGSEFDGAALPAGWSGTAWASGGSALVSGGSLTLDGARAGTDAVYAPGRSLEFTATFAAAAFQHVGFGVDYNAAPWAIFSTGTDGTSLKARSNGASATETVLGAGTLGSSHRYRIDWSASAVEFRMDGALVATHPIGVTGPMRPLASDAAVGGAVLSVAALRMTPYAPAGSFTSRVADAGVSSNWGAVSWASVQPAGTSLALLVRSGPTAAPDAAWTAFSAIASSGSPAGQIGRYAQYRADLATSDPDETPVLQSAILACAPAFVCGDGVRSGSEQCDDANIANGDGCSSICAFEGPDADGDGILNAYETGTGIYVSPTDTGSNPLDADSDNDGARDGAEVAAGTDPNNPLDFPPIPVPALGTGLRALLAGLLYLSGRRALRRRP